MNYRLITTEEIERVIKILFVAQQRVNFYGEKGLQDMVHKPSEDCKIDHEISKVIPMLDSLSPAFGFSLKKQECPDDKMLVDRNTWEEVLHELNKYRREDLI